jgi:hypothetical protein
MKQRFGVTLAVSSARSKCWIAVNPKSELDAFGLIANITSSPNNPKAIGETDRKRVSGSHNR